MSGEVDSHVGSSREIVRSDDAECRVPLDVAGLILTRLTMSAYRRWSQPEIVYPPPRNGTVMDPRIPGVYSLVQSQTIQFPCKTAFGPSQHSKIPNKVLNGLPPASASNSSYKARDIR